MRRDISNRVRKISQPLQHLCCQLLLLSQAFCKTKSWAKKNLSCQSRPRNITGRCRRTALIFIVRICCGNYIIRSWHNRSSHFFKSGLTQRFRMRASTRSAKLRKLCRTSQFADRNHRTTLR